MVSFCLPAQQIELIVEKMCNLQKHGGPDDGGLYTSIEGNLVLGNRRLSLLDLTNDGHMPMIYQERYVITYNGEIYNFQSIKNDLINLGHQFSSRTDTEIILASFAQWGPASFSMFNGMFAFALWDIKEKELYVVRDTAGIKPLYYSLSNGQLIFASEVRAISAIEHYATNDQHWPVYLLAYGHIPEPVSTLKNVKPLPKGFYLKYNFKNQAHSFHSFSHYSLSSKIFQKSEAVQLVKSSIQNAVEHQLLADAPIGVFLSGGLDSGILASVASKYQLSSLNALSIYFEEPEFSEKKYQDLLIEDLNCNSFQFLLNETEFHESFPLILQDMDMPSCDGVNTWFISKYAASKGLKAVLSGLGGDELFGGYPSFNRMELSILLQSLPGFLKTIGKNSLSKRLNRMSYLKLDGVKGLYLFLRGHFTPNEIAKQLGSYEKDIWKILNESPTFIDLEELDDKNMASWMEFNMYMQNQLLRDADVMSMIHGVEIRVPFLDDQIIRLANSVSPDLKYSGERPKQFLIDTFYDDLPRGIWDRPKMGFSFPFSKWLASSKYVYDLMNDGDSISINNFNKFKEGKLHWSHMMSLIILKYRKAI